MKKYIVMLMCLGLCAIDGNVSPCELEGVRNIVEYVNREK